MNNDVFEFDTTVPFEGSGKLKNQLVSEIDLIRDAMVMVNMFMGEPFRITATLLQELQPNQTKENE